MSILVPKFALYGEAETEISREFLHIEEICARSAARNWQIDTHVHIGLLQLLFIFSGSASIQLDSREQTYTAPLAVVIPPGVIHAFKFPPQTDGFVLTMDADGLAHAAPDGTQMFSILRGGAEVIALEKTGNTSPARIHGLLKQIEAEFIQPGPGSTTLNAWLVRALLLLLVRADMQKEQRLAPEAPLKTVEKFRQMVDQHYHEHWSVGHYAQQLNLTESRLNRICTKHVGRSAFALIQERLLLEAQRRLIYTGVSISQLAYDLGFSDPPYFCRFFKRLTGNAPNTFRGKNHR